MKKPTISFFQFDNNTDAFMAINGEVVVTTAAANITDIEDVAYRLASVMGQQTHTHSVTKTDVPFDELARRYDAALKTPPKELPPEYAEEARLEGWQLFKGLTIGLSENGNMTPIDCWFHVRKRASQDPSSAAAIALRILAHYRPRRYKSFMEQTQKRPALKVESVSQQTPDEIAKSCRAAVKHLRSNGWAVAAFSSDEVDNENVRLIEELMIKRGNEVLTDLEEGHVDGIEEG